MSDAIVPNPPPMRRKSLGGWKAVPPLLWHRLLRHHAYLDKSHHWMPRWKRWRAEIHGGHCLDCDSGWLA